MSSSSSSSSGSQSSAFLLSSSSLSSMSSESEPMAPKKHSQEAAFYIVKVPTYGQMEVLHFSSVRDLAKASMELLRKKEKGIFDGEFLMFHGTLIEHSQPILSYRLNIADVGELAITDTSKDKFNQVRVKTAK